MASTGGLQESKILEDYDDGVDYNSDEDEQCDRVQDSGVDMAKDLNEMLETGFAEMIKSYPYSVLESDEEKDLNRSDE